MTTELNTEEETGEVIYMSEFLMKRRDKLLNEANEMFTKATKLSKNPDPRQDPFASVLMHKVDAIGEKCKAVEEHIKFIMMRGNDSISINSRGYSLSYNQPVPPPVSITVTVPAPVY